MPVTGLSAGGLTDESHYTAIGWPQTIADTENEKTDFGRQLRATLTIVGTVPGTHVSVTLSTDIAGSPAVGDATSAGDIIDVVLGEFDVLNLETDAFNSDFSGTLIDADRPIAVFSATKPPTCRTSPASSSASAAPTTSRSSCSRCTRSARSSSPCGRPAAPARSRAPART